MLQKLGCMCCGSTTNHIIVSKLHVVNNTPVGDDPYTSIIKVEVQVCGYCHYYTVAVDDINKEARGG